MQRPIFILPNSPSCRVLDRFSDATDIQEDENGHVAFWPLLTYLLQQPVSTTSQLIDLLQTISADAGGDCGSSYAGDYGALKEFLSDETFHQQDFFSETWANLRDIALDLPTYFPEGELPLLKPNLPHRLSRGQVACLVVHQFLCSAVPQRNDEGYQDFSIWYSSEQRHPAAVKMYLTALFIYFASLPNATALRKLHRLPLDDSQYVEYALHEKEYYGPQTASYRLGRVNVEYIEEFNTNSHLPEIQGEKGAVVVSANKIIGFGQSATQEEIFVGIAPEACPAVLVAPHLTDDTVLTVSGARSMLSVTGQRRDISWEVRPVSPAGENIEAWSKAWRGGDLIFMDALEMDMAEAAHDLPDLKEENIGRDYVKAFKGFSSNLYGQVWTGLWGCGAFGGDPAVKLVILWCASSAAGAKLNVMLNAQQHDLGRAFERVVQKCRRTSSLELRKWLESVPKTLRSIQILEWLESRVS